ncbi:MAG TPA: isochorismatase family protein [Bryobacteraceae bacterium]|nr:isochorismatase family protein [Bryobacteraceae bacterium]
MLSRRDWIAALAGAIAIPMRGAGELRLPLRSRFEAFKGSGAWREVTFEETFPARETAIVICDMWDKHWCAGATRRVEALAARMSPVVDRARSAGIHIIHAPSDTMEFYRDAPQRKRIQAIPQSAPPAALDIPDPPLPIDDKSGGCDTHDKQYKAWSRQHPAIHIGPEDYISDRGAEIYSALVQAGVSRLIIMGVHTNMCILNRTFAIKQMTRWSKRCVLARDLTDAMYDPADRPFVSHDNGTNLVIEHIEKYWCPTLLSADLLRAVKS